MEISGKIKVIGQTETFGNNGFQKREMVVTTSEQYPQDIPVEFVQDKCSILDGYQVGQEVKVSTNPRGREWINPQGVSKYFLSLQGWKIERMGEVPTAPPAKVESEKEQDDIPF